MSVATISTMPSIHEQVKVSFRPKPVRSFDEAGLNYAQVESLVLKFLLNIGIASGRRMPRSWACPSVRSRSSCGT